MYGCSDLLLNSLLSPAWGVKGVIVMLSSVQLQAPVFVVNESSLEPEGIWQLPTCSLDSEMLDRAPAVTWLCRPESLAGTCYKNIRIIFSPLHESGIEKLQMCG